MKDILPSVPPETLAWRRDIGADHQDERWDGILYMPPSPNRAHQDCEAALEFWLRRHWIPRSGGRVYHQINVSPGGDWRRNYRVPDVVLLTPERFGIDRNEYFEGAPEVAVEIRSPGDRAYEKLPFYADLGVPEVWIIDRDARTVEIFVLREPAYEASPLAAVEDETPVWRRSPATGVEFLQAPDGALDIRLHGDDATREALP